MIEDPAGCRFEDLLPADRARVIDAWRARIEDLMRDSRLRTFTVVKNVGRAAGQTVAKRHSLRVVHVGWQEDVANERRGTMIPGLPAFARRLGEPVQNDGIPGPDAPVATRVRWSE